MSKLSSFIEYIDEYEINDIHENLEHIYLLSTLIVCSISLILSEFNDTSSIAFLVSVGFIMLVSSSSFFLGKKIKFLLFNISISSTFVLLIYARLTFMDVTTTNPTLTLAELAISLTMIFRYGLKRTFWVPMVFLFTAFFAQYLLHKGVTFNALVLNEHSLLSFFILITFISYIFFISAAHAHKMNSLHTNLSYSNDDLEIINQDIKFEIVDISSSLDNLKQLSTINSHYLRAPIARIQGLLILQKCLKNDPENEGTENFNIGISIKDEIEKSYIELSKALDNFEKHLAVKKG